MSECMYGPSESRMLLQTSLAKAFSSAMRISFDIALFVDCGTVCMYVCMYVQYYCLYVCTYCMYVCMYRYLIKNKKCHITLQMHTYNKHRYIQNKHKHIHRYNHTYIHTYVRTYVPTPLLLRPSRLAAKSFANSFSLIFA